ncbi:MAG: helix-turn-helix domain-containing protein [Acidimicrobiales bacterium]
MTDAPGARRTLSERQAVTVVALLEAGLGEVHEVGFEKLTIRSVARRAGVTHTTAYSYFTSKAHLISELYWRQTHAMSAPEVSADASFVGRVRAAIEEPAAALAADPTLSRAVFAAILSDEPDVRRLRAAVAAELIGRLRTALGPFDDPDLVGTLLMAYSGAMMMVGTGTRDFLEVVPRMETVARLIDPT